jgi:hypothetical protein
LGSKRALAGEKAAGKVMSFWNLFSGRTVKIGDAFFGEMTFMESSNDLAQSYFECELYFQPSSEKIGLSVTGTLSGPTQRQKDFFSQIEADYFLLVPRWKEVIEQKFGAWMLWPLIKNFAKEFKPSLIDIPTCVEQPIAWEITFDTFHDLNHIVTVGMLGYEPHYVRVDG